jgi:hypothetical protein
MDPQTENQTISPFESNTTLYSLSPDSFYQMPPLLKFWLFLIFDMFAVPCTVFVLYHLLMKRSSRQALHNHALILILLLDLVCEVIDIPLHLQFSFTGVVRPATPALCLIWWFIDWGFYYVIVVLLLFTSIERHILIFHSQMVATKRKRLLFHYLPLFLTVLFMITFYGVAIFAPICENTFDYTSDLCGGMACYESIRFLTMFEQIVFSTMGCCLIAIVNLLLLVRVIWQKYRIHRNNEWRKQRKLAIQVISISTLFLVFSLPDTIIYFVRLFGRPDWGMEVYSVFFYLTYFTGFCVPLVCLATLPQFWDTLANICSPRRRRGQIAPVVAQ